MLKDTLQTVVDSIASQQADADTSFNLWMMIAIVECLIIVYLLIRRGSNGRELSEREQIKKKVMKEGSIDLDNIVNSAFNAQQLYDVLIRKCHPDRFATDAAKVAIANDITMRLGKCKHDLKALQQLKQEAIEKLNINL